MVPSQRLARHICGPFAVGQDGDGTAVVSVRWRAWARGACGSADCIAGRYTLSGYTDWARGKIRYLEGGKTVDFVVLDRDPRGVKPEELDQLVVKQTWIGGSIVYCKV